MKTKTVCRVFLLALIALLTLTMMALPVSAAHRAEWSLKIGETLSLGHSNTPYVSSDTDVVEIEYDGNNHYTAKAVGKGTAVITGGHWAGSDNWEYEITVRRYGPDEIAKIVLTVILSVMGVGMLVACLIAVFVVRSKRAKKTSFTCPTCHHENSLDAAVCPHCGRQFLFR